MAALDIAVEVFGPALDRLGIGIQVDSVRHLQGHDLALAPEFCKTAGYALGHLIMSAVGDDPRSRDASITALQHGILSSIKDTLQQEED